MAMRRDTLEIKQELADILGANGPVYWDTLKAFLCGKSTKTQLDSLAESVLGSNGIKLHNKLVLGILHNAQPGVALPQGLPQTDFIPRRGGSRKRPDDATNAQLKHRYISRALASLSKEDRDRLLALPPPEPEARLIPEVKKRQFDSVADMIPKSCLESRDLPDNLAKRLAFHSALQGVTVSDDACDLIGHALNRHVQSVLDPILASFETVSLRELSTGFQLHPPNSRIHELVHELSK